MKYIVLVSHGMMAPGLHNALSMIVGENRKDILSTSLENGMGADVYTENVRKCISCITPEDEILLLGDLIGGSPLTIASNVIAEAGLLPNTVIIGGMNLPLALNAALMKDAVDLKDMPDMMMPEAKDGIAEFKVDVVEDDDDI
ncbi:PTS sugar transporter subunit IIA [Dorea sp. AM58-8]|uniref:PTS sugar transporter subunit IIA n=1 Tax=Dorea sp. AM58-8 TaxID=2292346 RepID=UPI000E50BAD8|nr:PTS fructose transporter subunit IIA [Dorea sp. AM58-8]RGY79678.1 PTS fructose transporter subunit IIA [Dorea sp. AM58-8]